MARMQDTLRGLAAGKLAGGGMDTPSDADAAMAAENDTDLPRGPSPVEMLEGALRDIEDGIAGLAQEDQEEARSHVEALREILSRAEAAPSDSAQAPMDTMPPMGGGGLPGGM